MDQQDFRREQLLASGLLRMAEQALPGPIPRSLGKQAVTRAEAKPKDPTQAESRVP